MRYAPFSRPPAGRFAEIGSILPNTDQALAYGAGTDDPLYIRLLGKITAPRPPRIPSGLARQGFDTVLARGASSCLQPRRWVGDTDGQPRPGAGVPRSRALRVPETPRQDFRCSFSPATHRTQRPLRHRHAEAQQRLQGD